MEVAVLTEAGDPPTSRPRGRMLAQKFARFPRASGAAIADDGYLEGHRLRTAVAAWSGLPRRHHNRLCAGQVEFQTFLPSKDYALLEKLLVWFQSPTPIPSPFVLQQAPGALRASIASAWRTCSVGRLISRVGRFLDWLLPVARAFRPAFLPNVLEVFGVWPERPPEYQILARLLSSTFAANG